MLNSASRARGSRSYIAALLLAVLFIAPLSGTVAVARPGFTRPNVIKNPAPFAVNTIPVQNDEPDSKTTTTGVDSFIIELVNGMASCREATLEEIPSTLPRKGEIGIPVQSFLKSSGFQSSAVTQGDDSATGLTINFNALAQLQSDPERTTVIAAFERAAAVWTARIKSPVTITIQIDYGLKLPGGGTFGANTLGSTSSGSISSDFPFLRSKLLQSSSGPDESNIYNALPTTAIPTDTGDGSVVAISRSLTQPLGLLSSEPDTVVATISFNKNFAFDFNPDNGIEPGKTDFVAVATHEIGHVLGFTSNNGEGSTAQVTLWDMYRFRPGTTPGTFPTAQRIMSVSGEQVYYTGQTFSVIGSPTTEPGLSTGGPSGTTGTGDGRQSSHWKDDQLTGGRYVGIMDPTIGSGVHQEATENDFKTIETLGWNLLNSTPPSSAPAPPANDNFANAQGISGCSGTVAGTNLNASKEAGELTHAPGAGSRSVWYQWQSPSTGSVTFTTAGSGYDTVLAAYTGSSVSSLALLANNDDVPSAPGEPHLVTSTITFNAIAGTIYRIAVDGFNNGGSGGDMGPLKLNWNATNCVASSPTIQLSSATFSVGEATTSGVATITRSGDTSTAASVEYFTSDTSGQAKCEPQPQTGIASERCDYQTTVGTINFSAGQSSVNITIPIINDVHVEGPETFTFSLRNATGASLASPSSATFTINDNDTVFTQANPIDTFEFYVREQYLDFLSREPDAGGFAFWLGRLQTCAATAGCDLVRERKTVSAGFFYSNEFLLRKGYFIYRFYGASLGRRPTYAEFIPDMASMGQNDAEEEAKRVEFMNRWVTRTDYKALYPDSLSNTDFVNQLVNRAGVTLDRDALIAQLNSGASRAQIVRQVVESSAAFDKFFKEAFISMQYFGYLRRDPDADGYSYWFNRLPATRQEIDANPDLYIYDMVGGFVYSTEYQLRFGNRNY